MNTQRQPIRRWQNGQWHDDTDAVSREARVHVTWAGERFQLWASTHDEEELATLALGHVLLEGGGSRGMRRIAPDMASRAALFGGQKASVRSLAAANGEYAFAVSFGARSGQTPDKEEVEHTDDQMAMSDPFIAPDTSTACWKTVTPEHLVTTMQEVMSQSSLWETTGCFHRCAVWDPFERRVVYVAEDIGRHNCLDRVAGWAWQEQRDLARHALFVSARITASLYEKAHRTGSRCLVSASAVSSAAIQGARKDGITLIGFCRPQEQRFNVYVNGLGLPGLESTR